VAIEEMPERGAITSGVPLEVEVGGAGEGLRRILVRSGQTIQF
jgi:hypothetical protein